VLGALAGAVTAYVLLAIHFRNADPVDNSLALLDHGGTWAGVEAGAGLAFGLGMGGRAPWARWAFGGLVSGAAAAMACRVRRAWIARSYHGEQARPEFLVEKGALGMLK
jgi:hypothetical protein